MASRRLWDKYSRWRMKRRFYPVSIYGAEKLDTSEGNEKMDAHMRDRHGDLFQHLIGAEEELPRSTPLKAKSEPIEEELGGRPVSGGPQKQSGASSKEKPELSRAEGGRTKTSGLTLPEVGLIPATCGMLGAGIALLLADRLRDQRKALGWTLLVMGASSTIPLAIDVFSKRHRVTA